MPSKAGKVGKACTHKQGAGATTKNTKATTAKAAKAAKASTETSPSTGTRRSKRLRAAAAAGAELQESGGKKKQQQQQQQQQPKRKKRGSPTFARDLWKSQYFSDGDRLRMFQAVKSFVFRKQPAAPATHEASAEEGGPFLPDAQGLAGASAEQARNESDFSVLYAGSYVDLNPSFVFPSVTYVDMDKRAKRFFESEEEVQAILTQGGENKKGGADHAVDAAPSQPRCPRVSFVQADYRKKLDFGPGQFDLVVSLYGGIVSAYCTQFLKVGGFLLANSSHGDVAWASLDPRYKLAAVVLKSTPSVGYRVDTKQLDTFLIPKPTKKNPPQITQDYILSLGRGIKYTRSAFAYLFKRIA